MKNYPMTDVRHVNYWDLVHARRMKKMKNAAIFLLVYIPVMSFFGGIIIAGLMPL